MWEHRHLSNDNFTVGCIQLHVKYDQVKSFCVQESDDLDYQKNILQYLRYWMKMRE